MNNKASVELVKQANAGDLVAAVQAVLDYLLVDDALVAESVLAQAEEMLGAVQPERARAEPSRA